jgi:hypothetical protein
MVAAVVKLYELVSCPAGKDDEQNAFSDDCWIDRYEPVEGA